MFGAGGGVQVAAIVGSASSGARRFTPTAAYALSISRKEASQYTLRNTIDGKRN
jgi:hypothetical protein